MLLVGDIGGTKTDLAVIDPTSPLTVPLARQRFPSREYASLEDIAREFLAEVHVPVRQACFAVAGPVINGKAVLTNLSWMVDESSLQAALGLESVRLLNDVEAMAAAVPRIQPSDLLTLQPGESVERGPIAVIALGTGLGEAFLTWDGSRYRAYASEGSHNDFGPTNSREAELFYYLAARWTRVSVERACSGQSIPDVYDFLRGRAIPESSDVAAALDGTDDRTPPIVAAAMAPLNPDPLCLAALNMCISTLGTEAGNLALTVLATGGVYVAGGLGQRILSVAAPPRQVFLSAFLNKGRLSPVLSRVPVHLILEPVALVGAACAIADEQAQVAESVR
jgi:glucokinase